MAGHERSLKRLLRRLLRDPGALGQVPPQAPGGADMASSATAGAAGSRPAAAMTGRPARSGLAQVPGRSPPAQPPVQAVTAVLNATASTRGAAGSGPANWEPPVASGATPPPATPAAAPAGPGECANAICMLMRAIQGFGLETGFMSDAMRVSWSLHAAPGACSRLHAAVRGCMRSQPAFVPAISALVTRCHICKPYTKVRDWLIGYASA